MQKPLQESADKVFEAFEDCIFRSFKNEDLPVVKAYLVHKLVWAITGQNKDADAALAAAGIKKE